MKKEMEGIMGREGAQPALRTEDGKSRLIYNLFDGFAGKKVKLSIEEVAGEELTEGDEVGWQEVEAESGDLLEYEEVEEETEDNEGEEDGERVENEDNED
jgi:hypothetical protein